MSQLDVPTGGVLALDLSSLAGWAYGLLTDRDPVFGVWKLPFEGGEGARYAAFENELAQAMDDLAPSKLLLEAPLSFAALLGVSNMRVMTQQYTLRGIAYAEGWRASIPVSEVSADIVRLEMLGQSRFAKEQVKREVVRYCRGRGWRVPDHNAGDACMVWAWYQQQMLASPRGAGPLFVAGAA